MEWPLSRELVRKTMSQVHPSPWLVTAARLILPVLLVAILLVAAPASAGQDGPIAAHTARIVGDATRARVILNFEREPVLRWFLLRDPYRLVVDLPETEFRLGAEETAPRGLVSNFQYGQLGPGSSRVILTSDHPFAVEAVDLIANEGADTHRMVVDIVAASDLEFETALAEQVQTTGTATTPKVDRLQQVAADLEARPFTVVLDPGHGGIDGGANGARGTTEKTITLAFALELRTALAQVEGVQVYMTRDRDIFLTLDERVRIARMHNADLFISIHADSFRQSGIRGATVYTVSDRPSDAESAATAIRENLADEIAGIAAEEEKDEVADILVDLVRRETHRFSMRFARTLVGELSQSIDLINNPHRFAGFRVLRAPDVPSVLLELGYLTNPADEAQLRDPEWRSGAIRSVISAIELFSANRSGLGG